MILTVLVRECSQFDRSFLTLEDDCDLLVAGIVARYPLDIEPNANDAADMTAAAKRIKSAILQRI